MKYSTHFKKTDFILNNTLNKLKRCTVKSVPTVEVVILKHQYFFFVIK